MTQPLPNSCPTVKSFLLCARLTVFHWPVLQCFISGELLSSLQTSILLLGEPDIHNRTDHVTWIHNYGLIIHRSVSPIFCSSKSASLMSQLICSTLLFFMHPVYYQLNLRMGGNTFCSAALSVFSLLHANYLWHTISPIIHSSNKFGGSVQSYAPHPALLFHL